MVKPRIWRINNINRVDWSWFYTPYLELCLHYLKDHQRTINRSIVLKEITKQQEPRCDSTMRGVYYGTLVINGWHGGHPPAVAGHPQRSCESVPGTWKSEWCVARVGQRLAWIPARKQSSYLICYNICVYILYRQLHSKIYIQIWSWKVNVSIMWWYSQRKASVL